MTTRRITRTARAAADLADIIASIAADNPRAARTLGATPDAKAQLPAGFPEAGRPYRPRRARLFSVGDYLILYREMPEGIEVLRDIHGRRDLRRL